MELLVILIFVFLVVISPFLFVGWVVYSVVRAAVGGPARRDRAVRDASNSAAMTVRCPVGGCNALNPSDARFCRRCGHGLPAAQRVQVRRAACW